MVKRVGTSSLIIGLFEYLRSADFEKALVSSVMYAGVDGSTGHVMNWHVNIDKTVKDLIAHPMISSIIYSMVRKYYINDGNYESVVKEEFKEDMIMGYIASLISAWLYPSPNM